jgi:hypothetical protein
MRTVRMCIKHSFIIQTRCNDGDGEEEGHIHTLELVKEKKVILDWCF